MAMIVVPGGKKARKPRHRHRKQANNNGICHFDLPPELFTAIFQHIFDDMKTARSLSDPLMQYKLVSRYWYQCLCNDLMRHAIMSHPNMAAILVKRAYRTDGPFYFPLFQRCQHLLSQVETSRKLLVNARNVTAFMLFADMDGLMEYALGQNAYTNLIAHAVHNGTLTAPLVPNEITFDRKAIRNHVAMTLNAHYCLDQLPPQQILLLCFLEDMRNPIYYSFIFEFINRQAMYAFRNGQGEGLSLLMVTLNQTRLPRMRSNMLYAIFDLVLLLAALMGDRKLLDFFNLDYEAARQADGNDEPTFGLLTAIESVHRGREPFYPFAELKHADMILDARSYTPDYMFDSDALRARCNQILAGEHVEEHIKQLVVEKILNML